MNETNNNLPMVAERSGELTTEAVRVQAEVQAMVVIAKKFPRDEAAAYARIMQACKRPSLAEKALYAYPRGGQTVTGPSIRLLEAVAKAWGNMLMGSKEITQDGGESQMLAYAWDIETNVRDQKEFVVKHVRDTKAGNKALTDGRDIYELTANMASRRKRACLMSIIPGDVLEAAVEQCAKTLAGDGSVPLADRVREMVVAFQEIGVTQAMIEKRLGHRLEATIPAELVSLRSIFQSIRDNMAPRDQFFDMGVVDVAPSAAASELNDRVKAKPKTY